MSEKIDSIKFLGTCILIASIVVALAVVWHSNSNRYQIYNTDHIDDILRLDMRTGEVRRKNGTVILP